MTDGSEPPKGLATWVPFEGQRNPTWTPQDTGVWPVQKLWWRDLTLRRHRSDIERRDAGFTVKYSIRPVGKMRDGLKSVPVRPAKAYDGAAIPLSYLGEAVETNEVTIASDFGCVQAVFTNGILAGQWLKHAIEAAGKTFSRETIQAEIATEDSPIRAYLTGDVLGLVSSLVRRAGEDGGSVRLALYELSDPELVQLLLNSKDVIEVILSNSSKERGGDEWDHTNHEARARLTEAGVRIHNRMFNNDHIGHNKFSVYRDGAGTPRAVLTGSTNWTSTGLCGQTNNAILIASDDAAAAYDAYWQRLLDDQFETPDPPTAGGHGKQGPSLRRADKMPAAAGVDGAELTMWFSPNTDRVTRGTVAPPDLAALFELMRGARQAIFFLAFLPSRAGLDSIIASAIAAGQDTPDLMVAGAISDVTAMPGYKPRDKTTGEPAVEPFTFDQGHTHIVRATALKGGIGDFEAELLKVGNAVVHDKIVVIDPLSPACVVATGSHNLGFKASYENDENLVIVRGNQALAQAYAVHVMDVYDHYRFRAWQARAEAAGRPFFEGHIQTSDKWLRDKVEHKGDDIALYFARP